MSTKTRFLDSIRSIFTAPPFENMMLSLLQGTRYGGFGSRFIPGPHLYETGSVRPVVRDGIKYELDISCLMQWYVFWEFKEKQRERLYSLIKPGDIVLDVGTNIGETLFHFARLVGADGFVYGFEPDRTNFDAVQKNISINDFANLKVFDYGISDQVSTAKLYRVDPHNLGMNRILNDLEAEQFQDFTTIHTQTLDMVMSENDIPRVDVIKIDIEGYEMHALRGAHRLLTQFHPALFIEIGYNRLLSLGTSPVELIEYLTGFGYKIFHAETGEAIDTGYNFAVFGDGGIDIYAFVEN